VKKLITIIIILFAAGQSAFSAEETSSSDAAGSAYEENTEKGFSVSDLFSIDDEVLKGDDEKKWFFSATGMYIRKTGNTDSLDSSYSSSLKFDNNVVEVELTGSGSYGETAGERDENKGNALFNFDYYLLSFLEVFTFSMSEYDRVTTLYHRNNTGAGLKLVFFRNEYWKVDLSGAPVYQYEKYIEKDPEKEWRWSLRGRVQILPKSEKFRLVYMYFYVPKVDEYETYRQIHHVYGQINYRKYLAFKAGYKRTYNSEILDDNLKVDTEYYVQAGISL
jgi:hypothetical protein